MKIIEEMGLSFDDVLLVPQKSTINSRFSGEIDLTAELVPNVRIKYPIISSNMNSVTELKMANAMYDVGGLGIIHRFMPIEKQIEMLNQVNGPIILCIGVGKEEYRRFEKVLNEVNIDAVMIDIAHGHSKVMFDQIEAIRKVCSIPIIAGTTATYQGAYDLLEAGVSCIRCGVGGGSICTTRIQTGCGVPMITALMETKRAIDDFCNKHNPEFRPTQISDGGLKNSGDIVKAFASGADAVIVGNLLASTEETPGEIIRTKNGSVKVYAGMASFSVQKSWKGEAKSVEGETLYLPLKGPVKLVFEELLGGVLSGFSYQNARNIKEIQENAEFIKITSSGYAESLPHGQFRK